MTVTVVIPTIPERSVFLRRALASVKSQTMQAEKVIVEVDAKYSGAAATRNRALKRVTTPWVAFLDDDDEFLPQHLDRLYQAAAWGIFDDAKEHDVWHKVHVVPAVTWSYFIVPAYAALPPDDPRGGWNGGDPLHTLGQSEEEVYAGLDRNHVPCGVTSLFSTKALRDVGGFPLPNSDEWPHPCHEDLGLYKKLRANGGRFLHVPEVTWAWCAHPGQTKGQVRK